MLTIEYRNDVDIPRIHAKMLKLVTGPPLDEYTALSADYLTLYPLIKPKNKESSVRAMEPCERLLRTQRRIIIARYIQLCRKFIKVDVTRYDDDTPVCLECGHILDQDENMITCPNPECGSFEFINDYGRGFIDGPGGGGSGGGDKKAGMLSSGQTPAYDNAGMLKAITYFQGRERKPAPPEVLEKLAAYMEKVKLTKRMGVDKVHQMMKTLNLNEYYNNVNSTHYQLTGIPCPDISQLEATILDRDALIHKHAADLLPHNTRDKIILQYLLHMEGFKCKPGYFPEIKTPLVRDSYNMSMSMVCKRMSEVHPDLKWPFKPI